MSQMKHPKISLLTLNIQFHSEFQQTLSKLSNHRSFMLNLPVFCRVSLVFNRPPFNLLRGCCGMSTSKFAADERSQGLDQSRRDFLVDGWMVFFFGKLQSGEVSFERKSTVCHVYTVKQYNRHIMDIRTWEFWRGWAKIGELDGTSVCNYSSLLGE